MRRRLRLHPTLLAAGVALAATAAAATPPTRATAQAPATWRSLGDAFEASQLLDGAARLRALESLDGSVAQALHGDLGGKTDEQKLAARFLAARLDFERGDFGHAI